MGFVEWLTGHTHIPINKNLLLARDSKYVCNVLTVATIFHWLALLSETWSIVIMFSVVSNQK